MGDLIPKSYIDLISQIKEDRGSRCVIEQVEVHKYGAEVKLTPSQSENAFAFLNDIGVLFYSPHMPDFVVLNPCWLIHALTKIVTAQRVSYLREGLFSRSSIGQIWSEYPFICD